MNKFKYSAKKINELIDQYNLTPVVMVGVHNDLEKLKPLIEEFYEKHIFYLDYWLTDCAYFGWNWSKDNGNMASMATITTNITKKFCEIYALILSGLGERMDENG